MAVNPRFEVNSNSSDGASLGYPGTHRGHFPNLERGSSFRDSHDTRLLVQGMAGQQFPGRSGSGSGERLPLSQVLALDTISTGDQKYARQVELRRAIIAVTGNQGELHGSLQPKPLEQQGIEELKRIRASLFENAMMARERSRGLAEATSKLEKYRTSLQTRKRVRTEPFSHDRPSVSVSTERTSGSVNNIKATYCLSPNHPSTSDSGTPKADDKSKGVVPNKRIRTSMLEGRSNTPNLPKSTAPTDRERDALKIQSSSLAEEKDAAASTASESWEKIKMKGRRSATKLESVPATSTASCSQEAERDHKVGGQFRGAADNRPRPSEGHGFRGPVHGLISTHKVESAQQNVVQVRAARNDTDGQSSLGEKSDRLPVTEKERPSVVKTGPKLSLKDEVSLPSPTTLTKLKAARAPRSNAAATASASASPSPQHAARPPSSEGWDRGVAGRPQPPAGSVNRKRSTASRPSSPPVTQWVGQRPQKMSRIARRMNLVPPNVGSSSGKDEPVNMEESTGNVAPRSSPGMCVSAGQLKKVPSTITLSQNKPKVERSISSAGVCESDDSEGIDIKSKDKWKKNLESEGRFTNVSHKLTTMVAPGKKSHLISKDEIMDGVRRQGRSSRGVITVKETPFMSHTQSADPATDIKQLRSGRAGMEKTDKPIDVKPGRPTLKKGATDRKALTRLRRASTISIGDISGESEDDHEHIVAAVQAATKCSAAACPNSFWTEMEPFFAYLTVDEREGLKNRVKEMEDFESELSQYTFDTNEEDSVNSMHKAGENSISTMSEVPVGKVPLSNGKMEEPHGSEFQGNLSGNSIPLSQRLLAALIIEGDFDESYNVVGVRKQSFSDSSDNELDKSDRKDHDSGSWAKELSNGNNYLDSNSATKANIRKDTERKIDVHETSNPHYDTLRLNERIALELQSVGLYPDLEEITGVEDDEVAVELKKSHIELIDQIHRNKERLHSLDLVLSKTKEAEERQREELAMVKLVEIAFNKRLGSRGGTKTSASKAARVAALTFAERTLARWHHYTETGESSFRDPSLREILFCASSKSKGTKPLANNNNTMQPEVSSGGMEINESMGVSSDGLLEKDDMWSSRPKEREILLEDVVSSGRQALGSTKGERKSKTKPRQRTGPLLKTVNGLLGKPQEPTETLPTPFEKPENRLAKSRDQAVTEPEETHNIEPVDLSHLPIPSMDDFVVHGDLGEQGQDLGSWLDFEDPGLPDAAGDFMGLDVPMDDLADICM